MTRQHYDWLNLASPPTRFELGCRSSVARDTSWFAGHHVRHNILQHPLAATRKKARNGRGARAVVVGWTRARAADLAKSRVPWAAQHDRDEYAAAVAANAASMEKYMPWRN